MKDDLIVYQWKKFYAFRQNPFCIKISHEKFAIEYNFCKEKALNIETPNFIKEKIFLCFIFAEFEIKILA